MLIEKESPFGWNLYLEEPSENAGGVEEGQGLAAVEDPSSPIGEEPSVPESFYTYTEDDGSKTAYTDDKILSERIRTGTLRHNDYTKKNQAREAKYKDFETTKATHDAEFTEFSRLKTDLDGRQTEIDRIEKDLKSLPPELYARMKRGLLNQPRNQARDPEVEKMLKDYETDKKDRQEEKRLSEENTMRDKAFEVLAKKYNDFDKESIMKKVQELEQTAPGDSMRQFMELMYFAGKGQTSPAEVERTLAEGLKRKSEISTPMGGTVGAPDKGSPGFNTINEGYEAAIKDLL